ncbi:Lipocalin-like [Chitinophaga costaii]|uniref:Lipocalin-like n=1 Tax=Chitinophaga costaii TaxID=1335309 RepID=A0A1C4AR39_9BACT|nr:lipocalin family protein [Chitinophaga costaii]SCB97027.1 Lipocalin-like [Chitinophaga costaii]
MQKIALLSLALMPALFFWPSCRQQTAPGNTHTDTLHSHDSSLLSPILSDTTPVINDRADHKDSLLVTEQQMIGRWTRPVAGKENETEGFDLKKKGYIRSLNTTHFSTVYEKWELKKDTLILRSHQQWDEEPVITIDTALILDISDSSLAIFPIRAAAGYEERYTRKGHRK